MLSIGLSRQLPHLRPPAAVARPADELEHPRGAAGRRLQVRVPVAFKAREVAEKLVGDAMQIGVVLDEWAILFVLSVPGLAAGLNSRHQSSFIIAISPKGRGGRCRSAGPQAPIAARAECPPRN